MWGNKTKDGVTVSTLDEYYRDLHINTNWFKSIVSVCLYWQGQGAVTVCTAFHMPIKWHLNRVRNQPPFQGAFLFAMLHDNDFIAVGHKQIWDQATSTEPHGMATAIGPQTDLGPGYSIDSKVCQCTILYSHSPLVSVLWCWALLPFSPWSSTHGPQKREVGGVWQIWGGLSLLSSVTHTRQTDTSRLALRPPRSQPTLKRCNCF